MNHNSPQPYVEFRFQDSLRKYEPPLRKKVKKCLQPCSQCMRRNYHFTSEERITLLKESRRQFLNLSREKLFTCSKIQLQKKQQQKRQISDFVDDAPLKGEVQSTNLWERIDIKTKSFHTYQKEEKEKENISTHAQEQKDITLTIQQCKKQQILEREEQGQNNDSSIFKRLFVSELEQESQLISYSDSLLLPSNDDEFIEEVFVDKQQKNQFKEYLQYNGGRIKVQGEKGQCYLSTRTLIRACVHDTIWKIKKRHPYLGDSVESLSRILKDSNKI